MKGDHVFFANLKNRLAGFRDFERLEINALTGSVLLVGTELDIPSIGTYARKARLFEMESIDLPALPPVSLARKFAEPIEKTNTWVRQVFHGDLDLADVAFISLMIFGIVEILRGNFKRPPWYTAFWYAFGILTKSVIDRSRVDNPDPKV